MKVLVDARPVRSPISGVARYCIGLINAMQESVGPTAVSALTQGNFQSNPHVQEIKSAAVRSIYSGVGVPEKVVNAIHEYLPGVAALGLPRGFDIVHETYFGNISVKGRALVCTVHDIFPVEFPDSYTVRNVKYTKRNLLRQSRDADLLVCVSEYTKSRVIEITGIDSQKIHVIGNGVDLTQAKSSSNTVDSVEIRDLIESRISFFLHIGNLEPRKNLKRCVDAFEGSYARKLGFKLVWAGRMMLDGEQIREYAISKLGTDFVYLGSISESDKWVLLRKASALIFPSLLEGYGIPVIEAYASKTLCVFSNTTALAELAVDHRQTFDPLDVDAIRSSMDSAAEGGAVWEMIVQRAEEYSESATWTNVARKTMAVYSQLV